ncbi:DUF3379 domain-containing protein [Alteromonas aestuariivivens]|uniref:DUF3379 domain-containing protein n=1 Tax=Alteromonas aestuariivivens TaxID=1938339 RepID=A0A3D8M6P6_9ALTE|nr:DUF3379 family protein [Alteromonas aestuariivivens]RDV25198.1 DUF3379 domain-containing protein [Alteromonas aestuariivivens]
MDELEFRRRVYANPDNNEQDVIDAATQDPEKQAFRNELKAFNNRLSVASKVPVPEDLAHKLIWQQSVRDFALQKKRNRWYTAMAASIAFVAGISFTQWYNAPQADLSMQALAHMQYAEQEKSHSAVPVDLQQINAKLAGFGAHLAADIGNVKSANYCHLSTVRSLHLILDTDQGLMSVFVLPHSDDTALPKSFAGERFHGESVDLHKANVIVVGENGAELAPLKNKVTRNMLFST